ncbi:MAG: hypothetical protein ACLT8E_11260 [Akkermansia sp.]
MKGRKTRKVVLRRRRLPGKGLAPRRKPATPEEPQPLFPCLTAPATSATAIPAPPEQALLLIACVISGSSAAGLKHPASVWPAEREAFRHSIFGQPGTRPPGHGSAALSAEAVLVPGHGACVHYLPPFIAVPLTGFSSERWNITAWSASANWG